VTPAALRRLEPVASANLVSLLEDLLAEAKRGELQGAIIGGVRNDGTTVVAWGGNHKAATMIGAVEQEKFDYMRNCE
jgi:hypothetical protein